MTSESFFGAEPPRIAAGTVTCLAIDIGADPEIAIAVAEPLATASERTRATRFHQRADSARHLIGRAAVRRVLARHLAVARLDADFSINAFGKPELSGCGIEFNISHAGRQVWLAFAPGVAVGIDVEQSVAVSDPHALAAVLHPDEQAELYALPADAAQAAFLRCWTRKEAVIKALGEGVSRPFTTFCVACDQRPTQWLTVCPADAAGWTCADLPASPGYHAAVAAVATGLSVTIASPLPDSRNAVVL